MAQLKLNRYTFSTDDGEQQATWNSNKESNSLEFSLKKTVTAVMLSVSIKTTNLNMHHAFLYISLPSLHYDVKVPNFTFCGGRQHKTTTFFFKFLHLDTAF